MKTSPDPLARFRALAEAYGSDLERWPEQERAWARELAARSADARAALASEQGLDALLAAADTLELPRELAARLEQLPPKTAVVRSLRLPRRAWRAPALGWAAAAAIGLWLGAQSAGTDETGRGAADVTASGSFDSASDEGPNNSDEVPNNSDEVPNNSDDEAADELADSSVLELASGSFDEWEDFR
jgi:hypothetical protein